MPLTPRSRARYVARRQSGPRWVSTHARTTMQSVRTVAATRTRRRQIPTPRGTTHTLHVDPGRVAGSRTPR